MHLDGLSDHAMFSVAWTPRPPRKRPTTGVINPVPSFVSENPLFGEMIRKCENAAPLDDLSPPDRVHYHAKILQSAAAATRDATLRGEPGLRSPTALIWIQLGRAIS
eukprot:9472517-Pyramimonas_sp.AAC.1